MRTGLKEGEAYYLAPPGSGQIGYFKILSTDITSVHVSIN